MDANKQEMFINAVKSGEALTVEKLIQSQQVDIHEGYRELSCDKKRWKKWVSGVKAIHYAAMFGRNEVIETLLSEGGEDIDAVDDNDQTPLIWAATRNQASTVEYLVRRGANYNARNVFDDNALHRLGFNLQFCLHEDDNCTVRGDLNGCVDIPEIFHQQSEGLGLRCVLLATAEFLVRKGTNIYQKNVQGRTPMWYSWVPYWTKEQQYKIMEYFMAMQPKKQVYDLKLVDGVIKLENDYDACDDYSTDKFKL